VPGSTANLGPGFDVLGLALDLHLDVIIGDDAAHAAPLKERHPATRAFRHWGGRGPVRIESDIPPGRGLGYSGAARVGGLLAAAVQQERSLGADRTELLAAATALEGHPDNVGASIHGGIVVAAGGRAVRVPLGAPAAVVVWIPPEETSTDAARADLPATVPFADAVFNVGRAALLVAALAVGDTSALRAATEDRLHQDVRLRHRPRSREALAAFVAGGAWGAWLSGSGPTVAGLCAPDDAVLLTAHLPEGGEIRTLSIAGAGAGLVTGDYAP
jgi:homoserine kinase